MWPPCWNYYTSKSPTHLEKEWVAKNAENFLDLNGDQLLEAHLSKISNKKAKEWLVNSDASIHLTRDLGILSYFVLVASSSKVQTAGDSALTIEGTYMHHQSCQE